MLNPVFGAQVFEHGADILRAIKKRACVFRAVCGFREPRVWLERALATEEPGIVVLPNDPGEGPSLQDLITDTSLDITVHDGFEYWIDDIPERDATMAAALEQAGARWAASPAI